MFKNTVLTAGLAVACGMPLSAAAAGDRDLAQIRDQIQQMKESYEARIQALEKRLQEAGIKVAQPQVQPPAQPQPAATPAFANTQAGSNAFNPATALILGGTYANFSQDPAQYKQQGFMPGGGGAGPGRRSFNLGESELTLSANIDPRFAGRLTFALAGDNTVSVEEAFVKTQGLDNGFNLKGGRFLSSIGYLNGQHAHAWDFVDAPLAYKTFLGGQYKADGLQIKWLAPTDRFLEFGLEAGNGAAFPGNDRNRNGVGSAAAFAHVGDDIGDSASWRAGFSYLKSGSAMKKWEQQAALLRNIAVIEHHKNMEYLLHWLDMHAVGTLEPKPGVEPSAAHLTSLLAQLHDKPAKMVLRAAYQDGRASQWMAEHAHIPAVVLPFTVGGSEQAKDLFSLFDDTIQRLLAASK